MAYALSICCEGVERAVTVIDEGHYCKERVDGWKQR